MTKLNDVKLQFKLTDDEKKQDKRQIYRRIKKDCENQMSSTVVDR